jgi:hypothetical protein
MQNYTYTFLYTRYMQRFATSVFDLYVVICMMLNRYINSLNAGIIYMYFTYNVLQDLIKNFTAVLILVLKSPVLTTGALSCCSFNRG